MIVRLSKCALLLGVALFYSLVLFNNVTDYDSNYQFVRHTLTMDTTLAGNRGMWRAIHSPVLHTIFYLTIILWEALTAILCWWGAIRMLRNLRAAPRAFRGAKSVAIAALTIGCLMWFVAFLSVGGEWFLMWQSATWNGQEPAFRMFTVLGLVLLYLASPEHETTPIH